MSALLQELNSFSVKITKAIQSENWEELSELLTQRQTYLEHLLNTDFSTEEKNALASVQVTDKLFMDAIQSKKIEVIKKLQSVAQGQKGVKAYYATATN